MNRSTTAEPLVHIAFVADWDAAQRTGVYEQSTIGRTLADVGFIHCAFPPQVDDVFARYYADVRDPLCLLTIDPEQLDAPIVVEDLFDTGEWFPHIYGPLPVSAVVEVRPL